MMEFISGVDIKSSTEAFIIMIMVSMATTNLQIQNQCSSLWQHNERLSVCLGRHFSQMVTITWEHYLKSLLFLLDRREPCTSSMDSWINRFPRWSSWTCLASTWGYRECWCCAPTRPRPHCLQMCRRWMSWRQMSTYQIKRPHTGASYRSCLKTCPGTTLLWYKCL